MKSLLVTDLDNTMIGDDLATIALNQKISTRREQFTLIYATGRSLSSYQELWHQFFARTGKLLLEPDYLITGVGSEIYIPLKENGLNQKLDLDLETLDLIRIDSKWAEQISLGWNRKAISSFIESYRQSFKQSLKQTGEKSFKKSLDKSASELILQPESEQNPWKLSYYLNPELKSQNKKAYIEGLRQELESAKLEAQIIFSSDRDLDILPKNSGKGKALNYLREKLAVSSSRTLVCGDSGNDITMFEQRTLGVIVRNSQPELLEWHRLHSNSEHYISTTSYAWGILEAIAHFEL
jgi:sucrose-6-phosphatase